MSKTEFAQEVTAGQVGPAIQMLASLDTQGPAILGDMSSVLQDISTVEELITKGEQSVDAIEKGCAVLQHGNDTVETGSRYLSSSWRLLRALGDTFDSAADFLTGVKPVQYVFGDTLKEVGPAVQSSAAATDWSAVMDGAKGEVDKMKKAMDTMKGELGSLKNKVVSMEKEFGRHQQSRDQLSGLVAVLGAVVNGWVAYRQLRATESMVEEHGKEMKEIDGEMSVWEKKAADTVRPHVLDVNAILKLIKDKVEQSPSTVVEQMNGWVREYMQLESELKTLLLELAEIEKRIVRHQGEASGRVIAHKNGEISAGLSVAVNGVMALANPWLGVAAVIHVGVLYAHHKGKGKAQELVKDWQTFEDRCSIDKEAAVAASNQCAEIAKALDRSVHPTEHKTLKEEMDGADTTDTAKPDKLGSVARVDVAGDEECTDVAIEGENESETAGVAVGMPKDRRPEEPMEAATKAAAAVAAAITAAAAAGGAASDAGNAVSSQLNTQGITITDSTR